jgi:Major intrinsic protein
MGTAGAATSCLHQIPVIPVASACGIVDALAAHPGTGTAARQRRGARVRAGPRAGGGAGDRAGGGGRGGGGCSRPGRRRGLPAGGRWRARGRGWHGPGGDRSRRARIRAARWPVKGQLAMSAPATEHHKILIIGGGVGATLMGRVYTGGHISAARYNPAVTLAALVRRRRHRRCRRVLDRAGRRRHGRGGAGPCRRQSRVSQDLGPAGHAEAAAAVEVLFTFAQC